MQVVQKNKQLFSYHLPYCLGMFRHVEVKLGVVSLQNIQSVVEPVTFTYFILTVNAVFFLFLLTCAMTNVAQNA